MSIVGFGVKNLRCLTDTGVVPRKPITLLVGRNSSGKSTFLRALPLLRQSVETPRQSPILWFDPQYVDFGSFADALNYGAKEKSITFRFGIQLEELSLFADPESVFDVSITLSEGLEGPYVASYEILVEDHTVVMEFAPDRRLLKYEVDSHDALPQDASLVLGGRVVLLPTLQVAENARVVYMPVARKPPNTSDEYDEEGRDASNVLGRNSASAIYEFLGIAPGGIRDLDLVPIGSYAAMLTHVKSALEQANRADLVDKLSLGSSSLRRAMALTVATFLPSVLCQLDRSVAEFAYGVTYIAPLRASALRAYRVQELSVEEVDPQGENLPMFLRSLSPLETEQFAAFTRSYLDFEIQVRTDRHHAEILIKEPGADRFINLIDVGFGYAEILPLVVALWSTCVRTPDPAPDPVERQTSVVAIEQPELHLHPAHQARLARMIVGAQKAAWDAGLEVSIMIETHSEALVNGLGDFIESKALSPEDVQIVLFEQDEETRQTKLRIASYDEDGALRNWPFGFFAPVATNAFAIPANEYIPANE